MNRPLTSLETRVISLGETMGILLVSWFDLQSAHGNHGEFVRDVALVGVADVELAFVLDGAGLAEVGVRGGDARRVL